ncbi:MULTISPECIES: hypothetical protein [Prevotella]|uniref:hypothetical protein n=1 Tax=Prevotella TaxID=838 RepID=UPI00030876E2|nr:MULTISPECIES: hypothetical protein [Prevotella]
MLKIILKSGQRMEDYSSACQPKTIIRSALTAIPTCHRQLSARRVGFDDAALAYCADCLTLRFALC